MSAAAAQINECSSLECNCDENSCLNRLVQNGVKLKIEVFNCSQLDKGKGVCALESIEAGSFVCEYMGEIISESEAETRFSQRSLLNEPNFILILREYYSSNDCKLVTCIDARNYGNIGRFINHSCEPNLIIVPVRIDNIVPHAALFATRDIKIGEELCYTYNGANNSIEKHFSKNKCFCMSSKCNGYLPANKL